MYVNFALFVHFRLNGYKNSLENDSGEVTYDKMVVWRKVFSCFLIHIAVCQKTTLPSISQEIVWDVRQLLFSLETLLPAGSSLAVSALTKRDSFLFRPRSHKRLPPHLVT